MTDLINMMPNEKRMFNGVELMILPFGSGLGDGGLTCSDCYFGSNDLECPQTPDEKFHCSGELQNHVGSALFMEPDVHALKRLKGEA